MTEPTPRPWKVAYPEDEDDPSPYLSNANHEEVGVIWDPGDMDHIVKCVNAHDKLVGFVRRHTLDGGCTCGMRHPDDIPCPVCVEARKLLEEIEGEEREVV